MASDRVSGTYIKGKDGTVELQAASVTKEPAGGLRARHADGTPVGRVSAAVPSTAAPASAGAAPDTAPAGKAKAPTKE